MYRFMPTVKIAAKNITKGFQSYRVCKQMTQNYLYEINSDYRYDKAGSIDSVNSRLDGP